MPNTVNWTPEEDAQLKELVNAYGPKRWSLISSKIGTKGSKQCRRRWKNYLIGDIKTGGWSTEEDAALVEAHRQYGNRWTEIAKVVPGRTDNAVKNRWAALCRKDPSLADGHPDGGLSGGADAGPADSSKRRGKRPREDGSEDGSNEDTSQTSDTAGIEYSWDSQAFTLGIGSPDLNQTGMMQAGSSKGDTTDMFLQLARELYKIDPGLVQAVPGYEQLDADLRTPHRTDKSPPDAAHSTDTQYAQAHQAPRRRLESPVTTYTGPGLIGDLLEKSPRDQAALLLAQRNAAATGASSSSPSRAGHHHSTERGMMLPSAALLTRSMSAVDHLPSGLGCEGGHPSMAPVRIPGQGSGLSPHHRHMMQGAGLAARMPQRAASLSQLPASGATSAAPMGYGVRPVNTRLASCTSPPASLQQGHTPSSAGRQQDTTPGSQACQSAGTPLHVGEFDLAGGHGLDLADRDFNVSPFATQLECMAAADGGAGSSGAMQPGAGAPKPQLVHCHPFDLAEPATSPGAGLHVDPHPHAMAPAHPSHVDALCGPPGPQRPSARASSMAGAPHPHGHHVKHMGWEHDSLGGRRCGSSPVGRPMTAAQLAGAAAGGSLATPSMVPAHDDLHVLPTSPGVAMNMHFAPGLESPQLGLGMGPDMDALFESYQELEDDATEAAALVAAGDDWFLGGIGHPGAPGHEGPAGAQVHAHHPAARGGAHAPPLVDYNADFSFPLSM